MKNFLVYNMFATTGITMAISDNKQIQEKKLC